MPYGSVGFPCVSTVLIENCTIELFKLTVVLSIFNTYKTSDDNIEHAKMIWTPGLHLTSQVSSRSMMMINAHKNLIFNT